jgi:hypothetical protein
LGLACQSRDLPAEAHGRRGDVFEVLLVKGNGFDLLP